MNNLYSIRDARNTSHYFWPNFLLATRFLEGSLHPVNVLMCPHTCVTNLPKPREVHSDVGPASVIVGNLVQGNRLAAAAGRDIGGLEDETGDVGGGGKKYQFIAEILRWRAQVRIDVTLTRS